MTSRRPAPTAASDDDNSSDASSSSASSSSSSASSSSSSSASSASSASASAARRPPPPPALPARARTHGAPDTVSKPAAATSRSSVRANTTPAATTARRLNLLAGSDDDDDDADDDDDSDAGSRATTSTNAAAAAAATAAPSKRRTLLDSDSDDDNGAAKNKRSSGSVDDDDDNDDGVEIIEADKVDNIRVNQTFAKRYEERKRKEELDRLQQLYGDVPLDEEESSSDTTEDSDAVLLDENTERGFFEVIPRILNKDPSIYDPSTRFFSEPASASATSASSSSSDADDDDDGAKNKKSKSKPVTVRSYITNRLLTKGPEAAYASSDDEDASAQKPRVSFAAEEQDELKRAFLASVRAMDNDDDDDDDNGGAKAGTGGGDSLFSKRERTSSEQAQDDTEFEQWRAEQLAKRRSRVVSEDETLHRFWRNADDLDESEQFLRDYLLNQRWLERPGGGHAPTYEQLVAAEHDDEDDKAEELADAFEAEYNFRHEQPGADKIETFARDIPSVRRKDESRKRQRDAKKERKLHEMSKKSEELRRLKTLKRQEIREQLERLQRESGITTLPGDSERVAEALLDGDFDPEEHDRRMKQMFGDDYYNDESVDTGDEPPVFDDDIALPPSLLESARAASSAESPTAATAAAATSTRKKTKAKGPTPEEAKKLVEEKRRAGVAGDAVDKLDQYIDQYYSLDYEDVVAGKPVRFKYVQVPKKTYGLSVRKILESDDRELNQRISLKKIAPYRYMYKKPDAAPPALVRPEDDDNDDNDDNDYNSNSKPTAADAGGAAGGGSKKQFAVSSGSVHGKRTNHAAAFTDGGEHEQAQQKRKRRRHRRGRGSGGD